MIDEEHLTRLKLWERPLGHAVVAQVLRVNYGLPPAIAIGAIAVPV